MGMGALVFGSGAMSVNAAFTNSVSPTGDMRVVADQRLTVEPGILFRDGGGKNDPVDPNTVGSGPNNTNLYKYTNTDLFGGLADDDLKNIGPNDVPAAAINDELNGNINFQVALPEETSDEVGNSSNGVFQVRNETGSNQDIAIRYKAFGNDAGSQSDQVSKSDVVEIFQFNDGKKDARISPVDNSSPQTVGNFVTVDSGQTEQIYLNYDTNIASGYIDSAASPSGNPFSQGQTDTVQLVQTLEVGIEEDSSHVST